MIDITPILAAIITVLGSIITAVVIPWLKTKISRDKQEIITSVADAVVMAVEQTYKAMGGATKKDAAMLQAKEWLAKYKITVDDTVLDAAIESAVKQLNIEIKGE